MKNKFRNNPLSFQNSRTSVLDDAYGIFIEILEEYAIKNQISDDSFESLKSLIQEAYQDKKIEYFLDSKFDGLNEKIENFVDLALNSSDKRVNYTNLFYIKHTNHLITNE